MADNTFSFANFLSLLDDNSMGLQALWRAIRRLVESKLVQERYHHVTITLGTADDPEAFVVFHRACTVTKIYTAIDQALTTADEVLTFKNNAGTALTSGAITITQSGSAAGDVDSSTPTANNTFAAGEKMEIETDGANGAAARCDITVVAELT